MAFLKIIIKTMGKITVNPYPDFELLVVQSDMNNLKSSSLGITRRYLPRIKCNRGFVDTKSATTLGCLTNLKVETGKSLREYL